MLLWLAQMSCVGWPQLLSGDWTTHVYGPHVLVGTLDTADVPESSGLVASRQNPGIYWTHNDSGAYAPRVWAFRLNDADVAAGTPLAKGYVQLSNATLFDWEDISAGPANTIYILDGGDNPPCNRTDKRIYRFTEPQLNPDGAPVALNATAGFIRFEYPDSSNPAAPADEDTERYDCEALMVHPVTGDIYMVTKRDTASAGVARVFRLMASDIVWDSQDVHVLESVTDLTAEIAADNFFGQVTGGDIDPAGNRVVLRNYAPSAYEFVLPAGAPFDAIFAQPPAFIFMGALLSEGQGESIAYAADGGDLITTAENDPMPVFRTPWALANVRVRKLRSDQATILWDTATAATSQVDYGLTAAHGQQVVVADATTDHAVTLSDVLPGSLYYYRAASGSLIYPPMGQVADVYLTTLAGLAADFDDDTDVDMIDFACLQRCLSGIEIDQDNPECFRALLDADDDVDGADFAFFSGCMSGPGIAADANCEQ
jgi:hypothetical protein